MTRRIAVLLALLGLIAGLSPPRAASGAMVVICGADGPRLVRLPGDAPPEPIAHDHCALCAALPGAPAVAAPARPLPSAPRTVRQAPPSPPRAPGAPFFARAPPPSPLADLRA